MTHSNHRQGSRESLSNDWVMLSLPYRGPPHVMEKVERFKEICARNGAINADRPKAWHIFVFDRRDNMEVALKELTEEGLGHSIVVAGLFDEVGECCRRAGTRAHTVNHSLGFWGKREKLPPPQVLEITTMCGHALVAPSLVVHLAEKVRAGDADIENACQEMRRMCLCDIFNHVRARKLMVALIESMEDGRLAAPQEEGGP